MIYLLARRIEKRAVSYRRLWLSFFLLTSGGNLGIPRLAVSTKLLHETHRKHERCKDACQSLYGKGTGAGDG
jgi:hypothetical protein